MHGFGRYSKPDFYLSEPKYMTNRLRINTVFMSTVNTIGWEDLFSIQKDANGRINRLIISNYTYSYNSSGQLYLANKFLTGYKFFYRNEFLCYLYLQLFIVARP